MAINYLYIHLDATSNSIFSKGLTILDFDYSIMYKPQNLLLLDSGANEGEYEPHTGLRVVRGEQQVSEYFGNQRLAKNMRLKWIDFKDIHFIQQLSPMEIAELLYFGHMTVHLHSPFFYKLQNNFVYFEKADTMAKVYYRHLDDFYKVLGDKIRRVILEKVNERKGFFKKPTAVKELPLAFIKELKTIFQEGVVLDFSQQELVNKQYRVPIHIVEDQINTIEKQKLTKNNQIATILYDASTREWLLEKSNWTVVGTLKQA